VSDSSDSEETTPAPGTSEPHAGGSPDDSLDSLAGLDLDLYADVDRLTGTFTDQLRGPGAVDARAFAAGYPELQAVLLPALRAVEALHRSDQPSGGLPGALGPGDTVGRFRIIGELGRGGMGVVYEAKEAGLERPVALKVLDGSRASESFKLRFVREARAAARLEHSAIVPVYGTGEDGDFLWYAMRKIDGLALDGLLKGLGSDAGSSLHDHAMRSLLAASANRSDDEASHSASATGSMVIGPPQHVAVARIGQRLAAALSYAHSEGVLHRDVKPGNVLLDEAGQPHLTDFGLCKLEGEASLTEAADIIGTLRYMPPEALTQEVDARGDVYGLGLVLYELLTLRPAFPNRQRAKLVHDIERRELPSPRSIDPSVPEDLERIVTKATAKLPEERYASADAFHADLTAFLGGKPIQARPLGFFYMLRLLVRRHRMEVSVAVIALAALAALGVTYVIQLKSLLHDVTVAKQDAVHRGALATIQFARTQLDSGELGATQEILKTVPVLERGWGWKHLYDRSAFPGPPGFLAIRKPLGGGVLPSGDLVLWGMHEIQRVSAATYKRRASIGAAITTSIVLRDAPFLGVAPSGDGNGMLLIQGRTPVVYGWNGDRRDRKVELVRLNDDPLLIASNLEAMVAAVVTPFDIYRLRLPGGELIDSIPIPKGVSPSTAAVLPSGEVLLGSWRGDVRRFTLPGGEEEFLQQHRGGVTTLLVDDGQLVASGDEYGEVRFLGSALGAGLRPKVSLGHTVHFLWIKDEHTILAGLESGEVAWLDRRTGSERRRDPLFLSPCIAAFRSPETGGVDIVSTWGRRQALREHAPAGMVTAAAATAAAWVPGFSSDGSRAAFVSHHGYLCVVGDTLFRTPCETRKTPTSFHRDGRLVAAAGLVVDADLGADVLRWAPPDGECTQSRWIGDDLALLCWAPSADVKPEFFRLDLWLWDSTRPDEPPVFSATVFPEIPWYRSPRVAVMEDSRALVIGSASGEILRWDVDTAAEVWRNAIHNGLIDALEVDAEAGILYSHGGAMKIRRSSLATGAELPGTNAQLDTISSLGSRIIGLDVAKDAPLFATLTDNGWLHVFDRGDGSEVLRYDASFLDPWTVRFVPGGQWVSISCASGDVLLIGNGLPPTWATGGRGFVDPNELLDEALAALPDRAGRESTVSPLTRRTGLLVASYSRVTTLDDRISQLRDRLLEYVDAGAFKRTWDGVMDPDRDRFGRFGWVPVGIYGK
jgi:serine/threonine protein kinase/WD40 repeat protein